MKRIIELLERILAILEGDVVQPMSGGGKQPPPPGDDE